ncbi:MAG TPA: hypothetical protein VMU01_11200 [Rhizomicrobium sp.]|nr:hypothetical protein [Rhizomicrobium sp.]
MIRFAIVPITFIAIVLMATWAVAPMGFHTGIAWLDGIGRTPLSLWPAIVLWCLLVPAWAWQSRDARR